MASAGLFYGLYSAVRDLRGSQPVSVERAFRNAQRIIGLERRLGVFYEQPIQHAFLRWRGVVETCNDFYDTTHFVIPVVVLVVLYRRHPGRYPRWRNTLLLATGLALVGFAFFPLMPPRLLPAGYHFVDTLRTVGGLWSFDSGLLTRVSNQFAAMPSLHVGWAIWSSAAVVPLVDRWWAKAAVLAYPAATVFCVVVTANHYFADAVGGLVVVGAGYAMAVGLDRRGPWPRPAWRPTWAQNDTARVAAATRLPGTRRLRWWREASTAAVGYLLYSVVRNLQGEETSPTDYQRAFVNAKHVIHLEQISGLYHEQRIQTLFLSSTWLVRSFDSFWALAHFLITAAVVVWLIRWHPDRYRPLRTALALATALGLVCFALFPTLPPRLLPDSYGFVDTWVRVGGIGATHPPPIERISDPFAAMPSLHVAWAVWCAAAVVPAMKRRWTKAAAIAYPVLTVVAVVVTGNHFVLDIVAGLFLGLVTLIVARRSRETGRAAATVGPVVSA